MRPGVMDKDLLTDVGVFLRETLANESLSASAESAKIELLRRLHQCKEHSPSPLPYLDMTKGGSSNGTLKLVSRENSECYEELGIRSNGRDVSPIAELNFSSLPNRPNNNRSSCVNQTVSYNNSFNKVGNGKTEGSRSISILPSDKNIKNMLKKSPETSVSSNSLATMDVLTVSASALRYSAVKCGILARKEKILFLEQLKKYWVALSAHTLFVYTSDRDSKPVSEIDIIGYQARPVELRESVKKDFAFEIFFPGKKTFQFVSQSKLEMDQWILAISIAGRSAEFISQQSAERRDSARQLPSLPISKFTSVPSSTPTPPQSTLQTACSPSLPNPLSPILITAIPATLPTTLINTQPEQTYDTPDSRLRPVRTPEVYEMMKDDTFYHYIDEEKRLLQETNESCLYKNIGPEVNEKDCGDALYYNLVAENWEEIYDTIGEGRPDQLYEPVSGGHSRENSTISNKSS